ncbi:WbqC family protein [Luteolibacter soli]|uniref:WbqC family protein n=1 Tax=Luteolibacter soli TaxID=3135280 RepID=A0ABU9B4Z3_9BACT
MKLAIMQPYFFPYIGYFQLMHAVDEFIVYDNIQFTKKGWINRNRILVNGADSYIGIPLKKDSDYLNVVDRYLADVWPEEQKSLLNRLTGSYRKAPHFESVFPLIKEIIQSEERNLFGFLLSSLVKVKNHIGITTPLIVSSSLAIDHALRSEEKVMALCKARNAQVYMNPIGGVELYSKESFRGDGIELQFLKADNIQYPQFSNEFVPFLSIIDVLMFNSQERVRDFLNQYTLQ